MRILGLVFAVMLLVPLSALAQIVHNDDVEITGDLDVDGEITAAGTVQVFGSDTYVPPAGGGSGSSRVVIVRQPVQVTTGVSSGFIFSNNQASGSSANIAQLMFMNENIGVTEKRLAQILVQTSGQTDRGKIIFRTYRDGVATAALTLGSTGYATFGDEVSASVVEVRGADIAEMFDVRSEETTPQPGMVVSIDPKNPGGLVVSSKANDSTVAGIISGGGDLKAGMLMGQKGTLAYGDHPVVLAGRAYCYVDATNAPVEPGDLLTTSATPGHAMKVTDYEKAKGAIIGKAMTPLKSGKGLVMVLVCLH